MTPVTLTTSESRLLTRPFSLEALGLVDSPPEPSFDNLTELAAVIFDAPVALVSVVEFEKDRQFFKSQQGLPEPWASDRQTPLSHSFCQHVVRTDSPLAIEDAPNNSLVSNNGAIKDLNVIAYLGVPIYDPIHKPIGALCVIDDSPRKWSDSEVNQLKQLAICVSDAIRLKAALKTSEALQARKEAEALLEDKNRALAVANKQLEATAAALREEAKKSSTVLQNAAEGIITFNEAGIIESANPAASRIFSSTSQELVGTNVRQLVAQDEKIPFGTSHHDGRRSCLGQTKHGTKFEMEFASSRVQLDDRVLFTWLLSDVTKRRELERQLAFAQKMESVGQLAAGIAHEINTPMQYVGDNLTFLGKAFDKLETLLQLYDDLESRSTGNDEPDLGQLIEERKRSIKLPFLRAEIPSAIEQAAMGTSRVAEIVVAMKEFSHPGTQEKTHIDLNKAIESTITISRHEWKYVAEVQMEFDSALPQVPCFPADLNQVLLNLIVNAAHAIGERESESERGKITVATRHDDTDAVVSISDTGTGIPESVRARIFEPFFTTKPVGKGTGQGLSIVYSVVVEKHGGTIGVESQVGVGTTFILRLPLDI